jgi:hypothetical protein
MLRNQLRSFVLECETTKKETKNNAEYEKKRKIIVSTAIRDVVLKGK